MRVKSSPGDARRSTDNLRLVVADDGNEVVLKVQVSPRARGGEMLERSQRYLAIQPRQARSANSATILRLLLTRGALSRSDIAEITGLSQGTVTRIVTDLIERGLLDETATRRMSTSGFGRPHVLLAPSTRGGLILAAHVGVDTVQVGLLTIKGEVVESAVLGHDNSVQGALDALVDGFNSLATTAPLLGATVVSAGWVDSVRGIIRNHPSLRGWEDVALAEMLSERLGIPIQIDSSVRASAAADLLFGQAGDFLNFIHVFLGNVIGVAMVMNRHVVEPANGRGGLLSDWIVANRLGEGKPASTLLTQRSMERRAREAGVIPVSGGLTELQDSAHPAAMEILDDRAAALASLLKDLNELMAPEAIFVTSSPDLFEYDRHRGIELPAMPGTQTEAGPEIRYVDSSEYTLRGAAASFMETFLRDPLAHGDAAV